MNRIVALAVLGAVLTASATLPAAAAMSHRRQEQSNATAMATTSSEQNSREQSPYTGEAGNYPQWAQEALAKSNGE